jgi:hypothetical protein
LAYRQLFTTNHARTAAIASWLEHYNTQRRHSALGGLPPISRLHQHDGRVHLGRRSRFRTADDERRHFSFRRPHWKRTHQRPGEPARPLVRFSWRGTIALALRRWSRTGRGQRPADDEERS